MALFASFMKIEVKTEWPVDSTRVLIPTIVIRGFRRGTRQIILAAWTWRVIITL